MSAEFEDKFIAFVDILGFSDFVAEAEKAGTGVAPVLDAISAPTAFQILAQNSAPIRREYLRI